MKRRDFMGYGAGLGVAAVASALPNTLIGAASLLPSPSDSGEAGQANSVPPALLTALAGKLTPPAKGKIPVAFAISQGVTVIDFAGPWEVVQDVMIRDRGQAMDEQMPFELYTVSETTEPLTGSGGLKLVPDHTRLKG